MEVIYKLHLFSQMFPQGFGFSGSFKDPLFQPPGEASDRSKSALEAADRRLARCEYDLKARENAGSQMKHWIRDFLDSSFLETIIYIVIYIWLYVYTCSLVIIYIYICINKICKPKPSCHFLCQKFRNKNPLQTWEFSYAERVQLFKCHLSSWDVPFRSPSSIIFNLPVEKPTSPWCFTSPAGFNSRS